MLTKRSQVWVEQPVGTGFSQGTPTATNEKEVAAQFMGFWKNFIDTFDLHNRKVYITGESYAGYYVPNIASAMLDTNDTTYFDVHVSFESPYKAWSGGVAVKIEIADKGGFDM